MLPFDGAGHSWRFSDVCRVTQLWLKAFSLGKNKRGLGGVSWKGRMDTCSLGVLATTDQCRSRLNTNLNNLTGFVPEEPVLSENSSLEQIIRDYSDYINLSIVIANRLIVADHCRYQAIARIKEEAALRPHDVLQLSSSE